MMDKNKRKDYGFRSPAMPHKPPKKQPVQVEVTIKNKENNG